MVKVELVDDRSRFSHSKVFVDYSCVFSKIIFITRQAVKVVRRIDYDQSSGIGR